MTRAPVIGITTYHRTPKAFFTLPTQYVDAVRRAGGIPLLIAPGETQLDQLLDIVDGFVISGGGDIDPALYNGPAHETVYKVSPERDQAELALIEKLLPAQTPSLYICRGLQMLNVALGGTLITHIPEVTDQSIDHRSDVPGPIAHPLTVDEKTQLAQIMSATHISPQSWHHQALGDVAEPLKVIARAADGIIEAVEMPNNPNLLAVQWHPELSAADDPTQQRLFDALIAKSQR